MKLSIYKLGYLSLSLATLGDQSSSSNSAADMHHAGCRSRALRDDNDRVLIDLNQRTLDGGAQLPPAPAAQADPNWNAILASTSPNSQPVSSFTPTNLPGGGNPNPANQALPPSIVNLSASAPPNAPADTSGSNAVASEQSTKEAKCLTHGRFGCFWAFGCSYNKNDKVCQSKASKVSVKK